ncbi:thioesterase family protein [Salisediminibacterium halotolerans]|uniref:Acyl-CoA thioester hydrolase n=1 Tax=Salisediminibacterium halotolerans TaxID=517425 RepID=A0A1H9R5H4_9BACI|nr:thioesterase family protein [Salisediminibacterium haloalkalitolerans]SER67940.1 acyl-CoA thioester hydrolase [Salisediminibacterium haloalkalitolerans]
MTAYTYTDTVKTEWVDYNGHMNDAAYAIVFSACVDKLMADIGLDETGRHDLQYTLFTLETHLCYLQEVHEGEKITVTLQLLDGDSKRLHVCFFMKNNQGDLLATSEQMLMGIDQTAARPAPFPDTAAGYIDELRRRDQHQERPIQAGRVIGIKKK